MRFALEIITAIKNRVGDDFPLSFRYAGSHKIEGGRTLPESREIARILEIAGIHVLHIDAGCHEVEQWMAPPIYYPEGCIVDLAADIKQVVNIPVITVGSIMNPALAEQIIDEGKAEFVCLGRGLLADPDWPNKVKEGRIKEVTRCVRCYGCLMSLYREGGIRCMVNPNLGRERYMPEYWPAKRSVRIPETLARVRGIKETHIESAATKTKYRLVD